MEPHGGAELRGLLQLLLAIHQGLLKDTAADDQALEKRAKVLIPMESEMLGCI
jgi:hypothetical protein